MVIWKKIHPFQFLLVHWFLKCRCSLLQSLVWSLLIYLHSQTLHSRFLCNIVFYSIGLYFHHQSHPPLGIVFTLTPSLYSFWSYFSTLLRSILGTYWSGKFIFQSHIFCLSILFMEFSRQEYWNGLPFLSPVTFCRNSPPCPVCLEWPYILWLIVSLN